MEFVEDGFILINNSRSLAPFLFLFTVKNLAKIEEGKKNKETGFEAVSCDQI